MRALKFIASHVILFCNSAYTYKFQLKTTQVNDKKVSTEFLEFILEKGCKYLDVSLAETLEGGLELHHKSDLRHLFPARASSGKTPHC